MTTAGDNITKANITANMETLKAFNNNIAWGSNNQPFQTDITGGDTNGNATQNYANEIGDTNITASTIVSNFRSYAYHLSRIRNVRLLKWYQIQGDVRNRLDYDQTNISNLNTNYATDTAVISGMATDGIISASGLDDFVGRLANLVNNNRNDTVTIEEFYCHSNCHGSCHGSL
jgi:hypothetical protein